GFPHPIHHLAFSPDGKLLAASQQRDIFFAGEIQLWDVATMQMINAIHRGPVNDLTCTPDGKFLVAACEDGTIRLWHLEKLVTGPLSGPPQPGLIKVP